MNVADAMTPREEVVTVELPGSRNDVLEYLQERAFSSVPVVKPENGNRRYRGLVAREDLIERPDEDQLALLMSEVPTTTAGTDIREVCRLMVREGERRVPVVEDGQLKGIITITDVIRAIADGDVEADREVGELARRDVNTTWQGAPLRVAERELYYAEVPYAVVLDDAGTMSGIITAVDVIEVAEVVEGEEDAGESFADQDDEWMWEGIKAVGNRYLPTRNVEFPDDPVADHMTADTVTVTGNRTVTETARLMLQHDVEQVPLVSGDALAGIVRDVDLLDGL